MNSKYTTSIVYALLMPVLLVADAIKSSSFRYKRWALTLFFGVYGSTITLSKSKDGYRHLEMVYEHYVGLPFEQFMFELFQILTFQTSIGGSDVYKHVLSYFVGEILGLPGLFFVFVGLIYGYFFSGAMLVVFRNFRWAHKNLLFWGFVILFILAKNVEGVNTVRTWTGLWVLVYGSLRYYETKKSKYVLLMFLPPFIHFSYFIMALPAYVVLFLGSNSGFKKKIFAFVFVITSFASLVSPQNISNTLSQTELGASKVQSYYREETKSTREIIEDTGAETRWYRTFQNAGVQVWALNILVYTFLLTGAYFKKMTLFQQNIFSIGLLTLSLSNASWFLYALTSRSALVGMVFILAALMLMMQDTRTNNFFSRPRAVLKIGMTLSLLLFIPLIVYSLSNILNFLSVYLIAAPFVPWFDESLNLSIKNFLRFYVL